MFCFTDQSTERIRRFYQEEENSLDVIFLGASEVFTGFAPALAYEEYGFTSYMYAIDANPGALYKYQLREVLKYQQPKLILVEVNGFLSRADQYDIEESRLRTFSENIPMSINKLEAIFRFKKEDVFSSLIPFIKYHGDWIQGRNLEYRYHWKTTTANSPSLLKGITTGTIIDPTPPEIYTTVPSSTTEISVADSALLEFISYLRESNLENVVFIRFPHKNAAERVAQIAQLEKIIQNNGYSFLNLEDHKVAMDIAYQTDYYNTEHLNIYGQRKLTIYLGNVIATNYGIGPSNLSDNNRLHWDECIEYYHAFYDYAHEMITNGIEDWPCEEPVAFTRLLNWKNSNAR